MASSRTIHIIKMFSLVWLCLGALLTAGLASAQQLDDDCEISTSSNEVYSTIASGPCKVTLQSFKNHEPLFITGNPGGLVRPRVENKQAVITIPDYPDNQLIACLGAGNSNNVTNRETATLTCIDGKIFLDNIETNSTKFGCYKNYARSEDNILDTKCGENGSGGDYVQVGFNVTTIRLWMPQLGFCHNIDNMYTHYAIHVLYGESINGSAKDVSRPTFKTGNERLFKNANMKQIYNKTNQIYSFDQILGAGAGQYYISKPFLAQGHLAPNADFVSVSEQMMTYYYINAAPQWQGFNCGNWLRLEKAVRRVASKLNTTLVVYTGTHGILQLEYQNSGLKDIYLLQHPDNGDPNVKIAVPNVFWKLIEHPITHDCVVVVGHNNVFLDRPPNPICTPITPRGWPEYNGEIKKGYFYYCNYDSFNDAVPNHPIAQCFGILNA